MVEDVLPEFSALLVADSADVLFVAAKDVKLPLMDGEPDEEMEHQVTHDRILIAIQSERAPGVGTAAKASNFQLLAQSWVGDKIGAAQVPLEHQLDELWVASFEDLLEQIAAASEVAAVKDDQAGWIISDSTSAKDCGVQGFFGPIAVATVKFKGQLGADDNAEGGRLFGRWFR